MNKRKTSLASFSNPEFSRGKSKIIEILWILISGLFFRNSLSASTSVKKSLLKLFGAKIGKGVVIKPCVNIKFPWFLEIGDHSWIGENVWIDNLVPVKIGANVCISQGAMLLTGNHNYKKSTFDLVTGEIVLEDGVWIGAKTVVCPGVICHSHSILTVGSIATKNLDSYKIYQGNPATYIRDRIFD